MPKVDRRRRRQKSPPATKRREISDGACPGLYFVVQNVRLKKFCDAFPQPVRPTRQVDAGQARHQRQSKRHRAGHRYAAELSAHGGWRSDVHRQRALGNDVVAIRRRERLERKARSAKSFRRPRSISPSNICSARRGAGRQRRGCLGVASAVTER